MYSGNGRAVGRYENPGVPVLFVGHNLLPLVEIGLTVLPKTGGGGLKPPQPPSCDGPAMSRDAISVDIAIHPFATYITNGPFG